MLGKLVQPEILELIQKRDLDTLRVLMADLPSQELATEAFRRYGLVALPVARKRGGWLIILFLGEMLTATAMGYFEKEISKAVVLALFVPLIIPSGGNSGSQAATLIIRAMALGEVTLWSLFSGIYGPHWPWWAWCCGAPSPGPCCRFS